MTRWPASLVDEDGAKQRLFSFDRCAEAHGTSVFRQARARRRRGDDWRGPDQPWDRQVILERLRK